MMADSPNGEQQRHRSAFWLTTLTVLYLLTLVAWLVVVRSVSRVTAEYPGPVSPLLGGASRCCWLRCILSWSSWDFAPRGACIFVTGIAPPYGSVCFLSLTSC